MTARDSVDRPLRHAALVGAGVAMVLAGNAHADTAQTSLAVQTTIPTHCTVTKIQDIAFSSAIIQTTGQTYAAQGKIRVNCTNGGAYGLWAPPGPNNSGSQRRMSNGAGQYLLYNLYADLAEATPFPGTATSTGQLGDGQDTDFVLYGRIPIQATPPMGTYSDQLTVTVSY